MSVIQNIQNSMVKNWAKLFVTNPIIKTQKITREERVTKKIARKAMETFRSPSGAYNDIERFKMIYDDARTAPFYRMAQLYEAYEQYAEDSDVFSEFDTRKQKTLGQGFVVTDNKGNEVTELTELLQKPFFFNFTDLALDAVLYGSSLIEFGELNDEGLMTDVDIVERVWTNPRQGIIVNNPDAPTKGYVYRDGRKMLNAHLLEIGKPTNLGLLRILAKHIIWKTYSYEDWSRMSEKFGMPVIIAMLETTDEKEIDAVLQSFSTLGSNGVANLNVGEDVRMLETARTDPYKIYQFAIDTHSQKISKIITGQSDATNAGANGSYARAEIHEGILNDRVIADMRNLSHVCNYQLFPYLAQKSPAYKAFTNHKFEFRVFWEQAQKQKDPKYFMSNGKPDPNKPEEKNNQNPKNEESLFFLRMSEAINFIYYDDCDCEKRTFLNSIETENTDNFFKELAKQFLAIIEKLGLGIWKGQNISPKTLENLISKTLSEITVESFGKPNIKHDDPDFELLKKLKGDVFVFSKAKTKAQLEEIRNLLTDGDKRIPFTKFKEKVLQIHEKYNVKWLRAEYNHAQNTAKTASKFADIARDKDKFDIKYVAVMDDQTRTEHRKLHGVILPVDDVFWRKYLPPLGWNCRCTFIRVLKGTTGKPLPNKLPFDDLPPKEKARLEMFTFNPAIDGIIFPSKHPYYKVSNN